MKIFDKWLHRKMKYLWNNSVQFDNNMGLSIAKSNPIPTPMDIGSPATVFKFYRAVNGYVVELHPSDMHKKYISEDVNLCRLHFIGDHENLGEALSKIITFESLRS
jgi:hypothetical protein